MQKHPSFPIIDRRVGERADRDTAPLKADSVNCAAIGQSDRPSPAVPDRSTVVQTVSAALSEHLPHPLQIIDLNNNPDVFLRRPTPPRIPGDPVSLNAAVECDRFDLAHCSIPWWTEDGAVRETLLDTLCAAADRVAAVLLFAADRDNPFAPRPGVSPPDLCRLRRRFAFVHTISEYRGDHRERGGVVLFCSNRYWYAGGKLNPFDWWTSRHCELRDEARQGTRRYFFSADKIAKTFFFHGPHERENRRDMDLEVSFLSRTPIQGVSIPRLVAHHVSGRTGVLVMERLPGIPLSTAIAGGLEFDSSFVLRDVLTQLDALERVGLYHNDVMPWNVLIGDDGRSTLVDFSSITPRQRSPWWPQDPVLRFFLLTWSVTRRRLPSPRIDLFPSYASEFPRDYRRWAVRVWKYRPERRNFALLKTCFESAVEKGSRRPRKPGVGGRVTGLFQRLSYRRVLIAIQVRFFSERLKVALAKDAVR